MGAMDDFPFPDALTGPGALQLLVLAAVAVFLAVMFARTLRRRRASGRGMRDCRWRRDRRGPPRAGFTRWRCTACGVEAYSTDGRAPKECKRVVKAGGL